MISRGTWSRIDEHRAGSGVPRVRRCRGGHAGAEQRHADRDRGERRRAARPAVPVRRRCRHGSDAVPRRLRAGIARPRLPDRPRGAEVVRRRVPAVALLEDRDRGEGRRGKRGAAGGIPRRGALSVDQSQVVARQRERGRDLSAGGCRNRRRAIAGDRRAVRRGRDSERLRVARRRRRPAAGARFRTLRPPPPARTRRTGPLRRLSRSRPPRARSRDRPRRRASR